MRTIRLINHNTGDVIERECATDEEKRAWLANDFERNPQEDGVYYSETEPGCYERYDLEDDDEQR